MSALSEYASIGLVNTGMHLLKRRVRESCMVDINRLSDAIRNGLGESSSISGPEMDESIQIQLLRWLKLRLVLMRLYLDSCSVEVEAAQLRRLYQMLLEDTLRQCSKLPVWTRAHVLTQQHVIRDMEDTDAKEIDLLLSAGNALCPDSINQAANQDAGWSTRGIRNFAASTLYGDNLDPVLERILRAPSSRTVPQSVFDGDRPVGSPVQVYIAEHRL